MIRNNPLFTEIFILFLIQLELDSMYSPVVTVPKFIVIGDFKIIRQICLFVEFGIVTSH